MRMKPNVRRYVISVCVGLALAFAVMLIRDIFSETDTNRILVILNDAFFISGMCLTCVGGLVFVSNNGIFYAFSYAFSLWFGKRKRNVRDRKYNTFYDYKKAKDEDGKQSCIYLLLVGLAFIAVALILLLWIKV